MAKEWTSSWKASKKPRKQRNYRTNAPLHTKNKFMHVHLSKELRKKYGTRQIGVHKNDKVKIMVGNFKKKEGKVIDVNVRRGVVYIEGIERIKKDGSKARVPLQPSNLMLIALEKEDKRMKKNQKKPEKH